MEKLNPFWKRGAAFMVDFFCLYVSTVVTMTALLFSYAILIGIKDPKELIALADSDSAKTTTQILMLLYYVSYFTISHWYFGRTIGKYFLGLNVKSSENKDITFFASLVRTLAFILAGYPTLGIGYVIAYYRKDGRALHDLIAGTKVEGKEESKDSSLQKAA